MTGVLQRMFQRQIAAKMAAGYVVVGLLIVGCAGAGYFGMTRLSGMLDYLMGPAWDTADGAMEASIEIEAQMLASNSILDGVEVEANTEVLASARESADECIERMIAAETLDPASIAGLQEARQGYQDALSELLSINESFQLHRTQLDDVTRNVLESHASLSAFESEEACRDWADDAKMLQLEQAFLLEQFLGGCDPAECQVALSEARDRWTDLATQSAPRAPEPGHEAAMQEYLTSSENYQTALVEVEQAFQGLQVTKHNYQAAADHLLETIEAAGRSGRWQGRRHGERSRHESIDRLGSHFWHARVESADRLHRDLDLHSNDHATSWPNGRFRRGGCWWKPDSSPTRGS
ncbi:MAG: hypothetical protein R3B96_14045 [Pirellulaceae bacterium]